MSRRRFVQVLSNGTIVETLIDFVSPFVKENLPKGSVLTVSKIDQETGQIICMDNLGTLWSAKPKDIEIMDIKTEKIGRFRILDQDTIIEDQNKAQE